MLRVVLALAAAGRPSAGRQAAVAVVCYRADRPLGTDAGSIRRPATPGQPTTFRLLGGGRVERPGILGGSRWTSRSRWVRAGDSLQVRLATDTEGWALRLVATPAGGDSVFAGEARYLSDARVVRGPADTAWWWTAPPPIVRAVRVWREPCAPARRAGADTAAPG